MNWAAFAADMILKYGPTAIGLVEKLWRLAVSGKPLTEADFAELKVLAAQTATTQMADALLRAGIDPASEQGKALLALLALTKAPL